MSSISQKLSYNNPNALTVQKCSKLKHTAYRVGEHFRNKKHKVKKTTRA